MRAKSLTGPVIGLYALRTVLMVAIFGALLVSLFGVQRDSRASHATASTLVDALNVEHSVSQLDAGLRSYLVIGGRGALSTFAQARAALPGELSLLTQDARSAGESPSATALAAGVERQLKRYDFPVVVPAPSFTRARLRAALLTGGASGTMLQQRFSAFIDQFIALRSRRHSQVTSGVERTVLLAAIGLAVLLALEFGFLLFLVRGILRPIRVVARAAAELARGRLSTRVPRAGLGEVAMLAGSFNAMAESTQERTTELAAARERLVRAAAMAEEASTMKSTFLANMSHEIRTPLNGLVGMLNLLSETPLDHDQRNYVDVALSSSDALLAVVGDVLDIAKIEAGRLEIEHVEFDLHDTVESVCELMAVAATGRPLSLQPLIAAEVPGEVIGDRRRVEQVLQNLVSNAVKFTPEGKVGVDVGVVSATPRTTVVRFAVRDTGIGIDPAQLSRLFEPFIQAEPATTRKFGGTGLGLAISRELTELMGGTITGESVPGRGSTFSFEIPFERVPAPPWRSAPDRALAGVRVLVADRDEQIRDAVEAYAESFGMRCLAAADADSAVEAMHDAAAQGDPIRALVLDAELGGSQSGELARVLDARSGQAGTGLVLMIPPAGLRDGAPELGVRLGKPVRRGRLREAIIAAIGELPRSPAPVGHRVNGNGSANGNGNGSRSGSGSGSHARTGWRILVAEDNDVNWMVIERMLASRGCIAERAMNGDQVLEMVRDDRYELLLIDCQMPVRDGFDTARELRRRELAGELGGELGVSPSSARIPIIAMTAGAMEDSRERCLDAGMDDYMGKPIAFPALDAVLERWLDTVPAEVLDHTRIDILQRLFPGSQLQQIVDEMREEIEHDLRELDLAVRQHDQAWAAAVAHRIRNTGQLIGARRLVASAAELDHPPRSDRAPIPVDGRALARLKEHWERAQAALEALSGHQ